MRAAKIDATHTSIVQTLRAAGYTVQSLARIGDGCPDILVGGHGRNILLEIKTPKTAPNIRQLAWHASWRGQVGVVRSPAEALALVTQLRTQAAA